MNRFVIADSTVCIGCRTCEAACSETHRLHGLQSMPRLHVMRNEKESAPQLCHHCEDAPCGNVCPTGAISREKGYVRVDQARCIGCKSCMLACPFGAMTVAVQQSRPQAIKCDLCRHREEGPACVAACPTQALACVDVGQAVTPKLM